MTSAITIRAYHSELAEHDKRLISTEFSKPDVEDLLQCSQHRVIIATDAMGMGINNPDIKRVIQWRIPPDMCALMQRCGRAARGRDICGEFICSSDLPSTTQQTQNNKSALEEAKRRSRLPPGIWSVINTPSDPPCIQREILQFFAEDMTQYQPPERYCCCICNGESASRPNKAPFTVKFIQSPSRIAKKIQAALIAWRETKVLQLPADSLFADKSFILNDSVIKALSRYGERAETIEELSALIEGKWAFFKACGAEVQEVIRNACKDTTPADKAQQ
ncbi:MAG: hypothetical protein M1839_009374 [Geoglossum umbratile]|nr:MAG: hypothetical protein M1839_009374 [Geoglossum umbratile]